MHSVLAVVFLQRNHIDMPTRGTRRGINISGVDFWHAVEFSRNGSFLRDRFTGPSGLFPSLCLRLYQTLFSRIYQPRSEHTRFRGSRRGGRANLLETLARSKSGVGIRTAVQCVRLGRNPHLA